MYNIAALAMMRAVASLSHCIVVCLLHYALLLLIPAAAAAPELISHWLQLVDSEEVQP